MKVKNYTELVAWKKAMELVQAIYDETKDFPSPELYGLRLQIRKAGISVPSNIAEGQGRMSTAEFRHHLSIAHGSLREIETQVLISEKLGYLDNQAASGLVNRTSEVRKLINGLLNSLPSR